MKKARPRTIPKTEAEIQHRLKIMEKREKNTYTSMKNITRPIFHVLLTGLFSSFFFILFNLYEIVHNSLEPNFGLWVFVSFLMGCILRILVELFVGGINE